MANRAGANRAGVNRAGADKFGAGRVGADKFGAGRAGSDGEAAAAERLRERLGDFVRASADNQARALRDYSSLLERLASRDIPTVQFAREALDLYIGAVGQTATAGAALIGEALSAGVKGVGSAAGTAAGTVARAAREAESATAGKAAPAARARRAKDP